MTQIGGELERSQNPDERRTATGAAIGGPSSPALAPAESSRKR